MIIVNFEKDQFHLQPEIRDWCRNNFGPGMWMNPKDHTQSWGFETAFGHTKYYFKQEQQASHFMLKWK